ncbi:glycosyl transferase family group 2-domain-containing protein [Vararia minispora EC-137]|uniref:Glycosyl transferase family group 2-domain-containing protein n=1 Tax=Vararia minispora EC-137 TaxID=1314806 RepID=A0ACB8Q9X3_9AGAM|nr:glycosyl transferase family group 2-domain-containing protein [Vararia minispora EC-137]
MDYDAYDAILHYVYNKTQGDEWLRPAAERNVNTGVCLRISPGQFRFFPYENRHLESFERGIRLLNPIIATKVQTAAIHVALCSVPDDADAVFLDEDTRIQILETMDDLPFAEKEQRGAFIREDRSLVVWGDSVHTIVPLYHDFDEKLIKLASTLRLPDDGLLTGIDSPHTLSTAPASTTPVSTSDVGLSLNADMEKSTREVPVQQKKHNHWWSWRIGEKSTVPAADPENATGRSARPMVMFAPFYSGLAAGLSVFFIMSGISTLISEYRMDHDWRRFLLLITAPCLFCVSIFFSQQVVGSISYMMGPVAQYHENSKYYSAIKPLSNKAVDSRLPHITVELPVYKESLEQTIAPSVQSIKKAMQTYARQGGTSAIFIHDDGLQLLPEADRDARIVFYADNGIGWVARPGHSNAHDGFKRRGRFKKASNMNYGLSVSLKMEEVIKRLEVEQEKSGDGEETYAAMEERALEITIEEIYEESGRRFKPWASGARALRVGEIILICDADTIVPEDCFRDAARELAECPEVAIIQHESDVMQVAHHYFENGITNFTRRINKCISMGCASGEVAPFVGHNAFLRWSALQDAAFLDPGDDNKLKVWSEANVSEDFDMALRLMLKDYTIRWATYSEGGFKEGVSLTVDDELNRWEKYSYGCNELIFHPLIEWWRYGPINKQLRMFLWTDSPVHYKLTMMGYMFSYYGLAAGFTLPVLNYIILGFDLKIDGYYEHSFEIWLACVLVFPIAGNLGFTLLEYRLGQRSILSALMENVKWVPFFFFFFGGLAIHLSQALLSHLFSYNITWGATKKEVERSNFFIEVPRILRRFWMSFLLSFTAFIAMAILATDLVPQGWRVSGDQWAVLIPITISAGSHILFPIVLNPWLLQFSY